MIIHLIALLVVSVPASELEATGQLVSAGAAWEEQEDVPGQLRIMTAMIEDALYSADVRRAWLLAGELSGMGVDVALLDFWGARIAWASGLASEAATTLSGIETGDPWLLHRAGGLALLYSGDPDGAVTELALSVSLAGTGRKAFYSSLDLATALLAGGETEKALQVSSILCSMYPHDALARVMYGLCLQLSGSSAQALRELSSLPPGHLAGSGRMAARLLGEFVE